MMSALARHPPAVIVDTSTADIRDYGAYPMSLVPAVAAFVKDSYRPVGTVQRVTIYVPKRPLLRVP
jgi:hypothetical protein